MHTAPSPHSCLIPATGRDVLLGAIDGPDGAGRVRHYPDVETWTRQMLYKKMTGQSHGGKEKTGGGKESHHNLHAGRRSKWIYVSLRTSEACQEQVRYGFTSALVSHGIDGFSDNNALDRLARCANRHGFFFSQPVHDVLPDVTPCFLLLILEVRKGAPIVHSCDLHLFRKNFEDIEGTRVRFDTVSIPESLGARQQRCGPCVNGCVQRRLHLTVSKHLSIRTVQ